MKKTIHLGTIALILALGLSACTFLYDANQASKENKPIEFSREIWDTNRDDRVFMIDDLLEKYDFKDMTKDEVTELLGREYVLIGADTLAYETGGGFFKDELLIFIFDESEKIVTVYFNDERIDFKN